MGNSTRETHNELRAKIDEIHMRILCLLDVDYFNFFNFLILGRNLDFLLKSFITLTTGIGSSDDSAFKAPFKTIDHFHFRANLCIEPLD